MKGGNGGSTFRQLIQRIEAGVSTNFATSIERWLWKIVVIVLSLLVLFFANNNYISNKKLFCVHRLCSICNYTNSKGLKRSFHIVNTICALGNVLPLRLSVLSVFIKPDGGIKVRMYINAEWPNNVQLLCCIKIPCFLSC